MRTKFLVDGAHHAFEENITKKCFSSHMWPFPTCVPPTEWGEVPKSMFNDTNSSISLTYLKACIWKLYINSLFNNFLKVLYFIFIIQKFPVICGFTFLGFSYSWPTMV